VGSALRAKCPGWTGGGGGGGGSWGGGERRDGIGWEDEGMTGKENSKGKLGVHGAKDLGIQKKSGGKKGFSRIR